MQIKSVKKVPFCEDTKSDFDMKYWSVLSVSFTDGQAGTTLWKGGG